MEKGPVGPFFYKDSSLEFFSGSNGGVLLQFEYDSYLKDGNVVAKFSIKPKSR
jgi:hypothetical protein